MLNLDKNSKTPTSCEQVILSEIRGLKDDIRELKDDMRDLRTELKDTKHELNGRMDRLENELNNVMNHSQIMTASVVGIALAVVYFIFTH